MSYDRGTVVWSVDPFRDDSEVGRPWLVVSNDRQPFGGEQSMTVALSTSGYDDAIEISDEEWVDGGVPRESYALLWAVHSVRHVDVTDRLGCLSDQFVETVVSQLESYIERA